MTVCPILKNLKTNLVKTYQQEWSMKLIVKTMKKFISFNHKEPYWGIKRGIFMGDNNSLLAQHWVKKTQPRPWWCQDYWPLFPMVNKITFRRVVLNLGTGCYQRIYLPSWHLRVPRQSQVTFSRDSQFSANWVWVSSEVITICI